MDSLVAAEQTQLHFPDCVPQLSGEGIMLRAHTPEDLPRIVEQSQDEASQRFIPLPHPYTLQHAQGFLNDYVEPQWNENTRHEFAIDEIRDGTPLFVGNVSVWPHGNDRYEIGYVLHPEARGRGVMPRAAHRILEWVFTEKNARVVLWRADAHNTASRRVVEKLGFHITTPLLNWMPYRDTYVDQVQGTLTRTQFHELAKRPN
ncbi:GNAT family N-acetyltransferase [Timonella sp. A28]|uniref:GNAT family N-acetyltransferase n=1 Tax=Timonella sp. A28 TaxID=3442640 RepID=UPI003EB86678